MITYKRCTEVEIDKVYEAFKIGFSDYIIKMDIPKEAFESHFLGTEDNSLGYSFIALDDDNPVGLILGGIKEFDRLKTLRCGGLCVAPDYRGEKVAYELFKLHKQEGVKNGCKQLFLEVIVGNDRAINFYKKLGYYKVYDLNYFNLKKLDTLYIYKNDENIKNIEKIDVNLIKSLRKDIKDTHINWQNEIDYISRMKNEFHFGYYGNDQLLGAISINKSGQISFIYVKEKSRNNKIASKLVKYSVDNLNLEKLSTSFSNNSRLEGFFRKLGFEKAKLSQIEMYLSI